jgi:hypothetical protein
MLSQVTAGFDRCFVPSRGSTAEVTDGGSDDNSDDKAMQPVGVRVGAQG